MAVQLRDVGRLAHATPTAHAVVVLMYFQREAVVAVPAEQHLATQPAVAFRHRYAVLVSDYEKFKTADSKVFLNIQ